MSRAPAIASMGIVCVVIALASTAAAFDVVSTRDEIEFIGGSATTWFQADGARWRNGTFPTIQLPTSVLRCSSVVTIYVHGFNNSHEEALEIFAQVEKALREQGHVAPLIGYSWDSKPGLNNFDMAREAATLNGKALRDFLRRAKELCPEIQINLIAHSLGSRIVLEALKCGGCAATTQLLAAAVDNEALDAKEEFGNRAIAMNTMDKLHVYINDADTVLERAYVLEEGDSALGETGPESKMCLPTGVTTSDVEQKMKDDANPDGTTPNPDREARGRQAEADHSGYIWCPSVIKCVVMRLVE